MSKTFELLEKRGHIRKYSDKAPPKELIEEALWKAWKTTPSKNNAMPYKVCVFGPEHSQVKEKIWSLCVKNHATAENEAVEVAGASGSANLAGRGSIAQVSQSAVRAF